VDKKKSLDTYSTTASNRRELIDGLWFMDYNEVEVTPRLKSL